MRAHQTFAVAVGCLCAAPALALPYGDVDGNGRVNAGDAIATVRIAAGRVNATADQATAADVAPFPGVNGRKVGDGRTNLVDAVKILRRASGLMTQAQFAPLQAPDLVGHWVGAWHNVTFNSDGSLTADVTVDTTAHTITTTVAVGGGVFGVGNAPTTTDTNPYDDTGITVDKQNAFWGHITGKAYPDGSGGGQCENPPAAPGISKMTVQATAAASSPSHVEGTYIVYFTFGGTANGTWYANKQ